MELSLNSYEWRRLKSCIFIVSCTALLAILSSRNELGLISGWPAALCLAIFLLDYQLGPICFILSFAYEAPVVLAAQYGLGAFIRLDELIFLPLLVSWILRYSTGKSKFNTNAPLFILFTLYFILVFLSLILRYDAISSTAFINTATGWKGLGPLIYKAIEVVLGYMIITDVTLRDGTKKIMFYSLFVVAIFAPTLAFLVSHGFIKTGLFALVTEYDPQGFYTRFSLYGNTSAWGVLLVSYFFILLCFNVFINRPAAKLISLLVMCFCIDGILISGTKTAMICILFGSAIMILRNIKHIILNIKSIVLIFVIIIVMSWFLSHLTTESQKGSIATQVETASLGGGLFGVNETIGDTSIGVRLEQLGLAWNLLIEDPTHLILGQGWQSRANNPLGVAPHNDITNAILDMGIIGAFFVIGYYILMICQFKAKYGDKGLGKRFALVREALLVIAVLMMVSSFTGENLTFYPGIDVVFPFLTMVSGVAWNYITHIRENINVVFS